MTSYFAQLVARAQPPDAGLVLPPADVTVQPAINDWLQRENDRLYPPVSANSIVTEMQPLSQVPQPRVTKAIASDASSPRAANDAGDGAVTPYLATHVERSVAANSLPPAAAIAAGEHSNMVEHDSISFQPQMPHTTGAVSAPQQIKPALPDSGDTDSLLPPQALQKSIQPSSRTEKRKLTPQENAAADYKSPEPAQKTQKRGKTKQAPTLVIGKITVEIVPPEKPAAPKTATRVVHQAPAPAASPHKLSFGLGQL